MKKQVPLLSNALEANHVSDAGKRPDTHTDFFDYK